jgi:hypothetical protein
VHSSNAAILELALKQESHRIAVTAKPVSVPALPMGSESSRVSPASDLLSSHHARRFYYQARLVSHLIMSF